MRYNSLEDRRWLPVRNDSGEAVPPFAAMRITGRATSGAVSFLTVAKPNADTEENPTDGLLIINGETEIPVGGYGRASQDWPAQVRQDGTTSTSGDEIGPTDGDWTFSSSGTGFTRLSGGITVASGVILVWVAPRLAGLGRKRLVRFTIDAALATTDASVAATITNQYGPGSDASNTAITAHNMLTSVVGEYLFSGASGAAGLAYWDADQNYRIIQMECP